MFMPSGSKTPRFMGFKVQGSMFKVLDLTPVTG
jgi:hypothetical protein